MAEALAKKSAPGRKLLAAARFLPRLVAGGVFVWFGIQKALDPVDFLKQIHAYEFFPEGLWMNWTAAILPWAEIVLGACLVTGIRLRPAALLSVALLVFFTAAVFLRGWALHAETGAALCAVRFDCGCGAGEVWLCRKLAENGVLLAAALLVLLWRGAPARRGP
ncbi:MAG: DoxX family membrane protein [Verrucomicrobia bacterium]|nr:DoxX family membrane protein [Verrucomicrobiota bacterium]